VKYEASKSGEDDAEIDELMDQLGRYAQALDELYPDLKSKLVVYLTASSVPPTEELVDSWIAIKKNTKLHPTDALRWLSWRDVDRILRDRAKQTPAGSIASRRVLRVRALLKRAGLHCFEGWPLDGPCPAVTAPPSDISAWLKATSARWHIERARRRACLPPPVVPQKKTGIGWRIGSP